ncbi:MULTISPECIES: hypothetical protein [unclassified Synechocystis]|uniref:hypothetical protein n=1 Tax=unclassified Synechocystis TaxID=2640012 RepID=UPI0004090204|nr:MULTISPECIES: hypothetical protein [unclassified Synechocystis]AIE73547.1 hypothetical protein D082_10190 [Synechocystis sp. PCC 6714]MCT0254117.1 hypothetical protein [Synechocystis sp. CS-94]
MVVQVYRATAGEVQKAVANSGIDSAFDYVPVGVGLYVGTKTKPFNLRAVEEQVRAVENQNLGHLLLVYEHLLLHYLCPHWLELTS